MDPWGKISRLSREEIHDLQNKKLHSFVNTQLYPFSPYYQRLFDRHKINPKKIKTIDDLRQIPFTSKVDFISSDEHAEKFREFILQPDSTKMRQWWPKHKLLYLALTSFLKGSIFTKERLSREYRPIFMTFTTGTTNQPIAHLYSQYDIDNLYVSGCRMLTLFNVEHSERVVNMFPYAPHLAFWQVVFGGLSFGLLAMNTGGGKVMGTEGNIKALSRMKPSVILGVPSYVYHVLRSAKEKGCKMDFIKTVVLGAARITDAFKLRLKGLLESMGACDVSILGTYGFTEARTAWAECFSKDGASSGYHLYPEKEIFEVIDSNTGQRKGEGEDGELVYTSIDARGSCVLRYRTGDFVKGGIIYQSCPYCHRTVARICSDITRISDIRDLQLSKIKGALVNLNNFTLVLSEFEEVDEWQIEIRKKDNDPFEVDELVFYLSVKDTKNHAELETAIRKYTHLQTEVTPNKIVFVSFEEMVRRLELETASKEKRIVDLRPKA